ncbi:MAG: T9SS C-terminal target domain-containing protein, partial [Bacteroidetes bacterium]
VSVNIFYNSVLIDYAATNSDNVSAALSIHNINNPVDLRNNIFVNKTSLPSGGEGFATAFLKNTAALGNIQPDSDNNIYYAGTPSPQNLIFRGSTTAMDQTLAEYKLRAATFDQNSYTEDVPFLASDDLHVDPLATTVVRGNAQPVTSPFAITEDIDGMLRDPENPDIGADELPVAMPDVATNPLPQNGATDVMADIGSLQWSYLENLYFVNPAGFRVYLGTEEDLTESDYIGWIEYEQGTETFSAEIDDLSFSTTYYWSVVPSLDEEEGPDAEEPAVWSFTTGPFSYDYPNPAENPLPENNAENVNIGIAALSWEFVFNEMFTEPAGFLVYFSENDNFTEDDMIAWVEYDDKEEVYTASIESIDLQYLTGYYWKVVPTVSQEDGPEAENVAIWTFSTEAFVHDFPNTAENPAPADGATQVSLELAELVWDYVYDENFALAHGFWIYLGTSSEFTEDDLLGWINYDEDLTSYSIALEDFTPEPLTLCYWQVIPSADMENGPLAENVQTWSFTTDQGVSAGSAEMTAFLMYPNPASEKLFLTVPHQGLIRIISIDGRIVKEQEVSDVSVELSLTHFKEGTYIVNFVSAFQNTTHILVITK